MSELIQLREGPIVTAESIALAVALENEGHTIATADGKLTVSNGSTLTAAQREQITAQRRHLMALAAYIPPDPR